MGFRSPKHIEQVKQIKQSQQRLLCKNPTFRESSNHHATNRMTKTTASQLPMPSKRLNRLRSMDYLNLISIRYALIYVHPYFATGFHRNCAGDSFAETKGGNIATLTPPMKRCKVRTDSLGNCNPTTGLYGGYIWRQGEFVNENVTDDTVKFRLIR